MRLRRLLIEQYGNFERLDLVLSAEPGRINLVVAPNGAGKSVLRQAFHDLLFGYATKSKMNFRYRTGLNLQAEAVTRSGEDLQFGWRQPGGRAFPNADPSAAARFGAALGGIKPAQLENLFALDTARLREGGEELAQGGDSLGLALLSGTGELTSAKSARTDLAARRDAIWAGTRLSARPLARAAKGLDDARKKARGAVQLPVQRVRDVTAWEAEADRLKAARESHAAMQEKASRLARIDRTRRFLEEYRAAADWLAAHPEAPVLAASLADDLATARKDVSLTTAKLADAQQALAHDEAAAEALALDHPALDQATALDELHLALGRTEKAAGDILKVEAERSGFHTRMKAALRDLGATVPVEAAADLLPRLADEATARQLIAQYASRVDAQEADARRVRLAQDALGRLQAQALTMPVPLEALEILLQAVRADRDPARHLAEASQAERDASAAEAKALSAIPGWSGTMAALRQQAVIPQGVFDRLDRDRNAAATALRDAETARDRLVQDRSAWSRALQDMQDRPLPDHQTIAERRNRRDQVWHLIYQQAFTATPPGPAQIEALVGTEALPLAFARLMGEVDALVDLRLQELSRVQEAERLVGELARSAGPLDALAAAALQARLSFDASDAAYAAPCSMLGLDRQASLADIRSALAQRAAAIAAGLAADQARADHQAVLDGQAAWSRQLRVLLPGQDAAPFTTLLAAADALVRAQADAKAAHIQHAADTSNAARALGEATSDLQASTLALEHWRQRWAVCLAALNRPPDEAPAATDAVLQGLAGLGSAHAAAAELGRRITEMGEEVAEFSRDVAGLSARLGVAMDADIFATARRLIARYDAAQTQRALADAARARVTRTQVARQRALEQERQAQHHLQAIIASCGATDGEDADRRIAASRERTRQEAIRTAATTGLGDHGEGRPMAELQADADAVTADQAATEREQTQAALAAARDASEAAAGKVRDLQQQLDTAADDTDLSESMRSQEGAAATFGRLLDDYLVLSLAEQMLARSVAEVEAQAGSNGVSRIAAAFARVTNGDYTIDSEEGPDGKTMLVAIERHWPNEKKPLAHLSEGTRDQLYMALRIVAIEDHAAGAAPLPFVADDILQTFDDTRALAALQALLTLSQHTQIIVLTHHPHVAVLAARLPPGSVHLASLPGAGVSVEQDE